MVAWYRFRDEASGGRTGPRIVPRSSFVVFFFLFFFISEVQPQKTFCSPGPV